jgi:alkylhydroperoxidase/carboxymuconolactone decarboxylase family protein YurZ
VSRTRASGSLISVRSIFTQLTGGFMSEQPVLDTLTDMTAASVDHNSLSPRDYMLARVAALVAVDAPPMSWFANAPAIQESGLTTEDIQGVLIAVAPVVGGPRVMAAGGHILRALGIAIAVADAEIAEAELAEADGS